MQVHLKITGRVQGVYYRAYVQEKAQKVPDLQGWVRNRSGGWVEVYARGPQEAIDRLLLICRKGSLLSRVQGIENINVPDTDLPPIESGPFQVQGSV